MLKVAIFGGGVAGLTAAHELCERGFAVSVYEKKAVFGGKARSLSVPGTATGGRKDLPGEHGFRFFPQFYRHLPDTMRRIPLNSGGNVSEHLVNATRILVARAGGPAVDLLARLPQDCDDWLVALHALLTGIGVPDDEAAYFVDRLLVLLTTCVERRLAEYEQIDWWKFIGADERSKAYQTLLGQGLTRSLVALRAEEGSTRTVGYTLLQLFAGIITPQGFDRLLTGPTSEVWIDPWIAYLQGRGVEFQTSSEATQFLAGGTGVSGAKVERNGTAGIVTADYYIAALPVEAMTALVTAELAASAPSLGSLAALRTRWMNGIQLYLKDDVALEPGHTIYADSPWALTSISQRQFWRDASLGNYGNGGVGGILSVDVSEWEQPGILFGKPARQCTAAEIQQEVWAQLKNHLNVGGAEPIRDDNLLSWFLDTDISFPNQSGVLNQEPLLVNTVNSLKSRPEAVTEIPNFFVASDYVRTYTDVACMEAANEAARRAVNGILEHCGAGRQAALWPLSEPEFFEPFRKYDLVRFKLGLPHSTLAS